MKPILIASLLSSTLSHHEEPKEPFNQAIHCSIYALVASTHVPSDHLMKDWRYEFVEWSKVANKIGATEGQYVSTSQKGFEIFDEMMEGERFAVASYLYRTEGCSNGRHNN
ncbi:hypothetical protein IS519_21455 [Vibrio crassostreae]|uniref:hypothetical protein n=1 Tax=Vibrio crassostreae TaxID=246167 RepID=UPI00200A1E4F|nr:hypothetical protein [Vibrio crassostreae]UPR31428.1 hypothetical protein IS519_21455 [Vibrio crassostreae]